MAQIIQHPHAGNPPVVQTRKCGRLPLHITSLQRLRNARRFAAYMERTRLEAKQKGYVETVFGRRLHLPDIRAQQVGRRQAAERAAINAPMQGTAADLIKKAMIAVSAWLKASGVKSRLILQVHDELVLEVPDAEVALIREQLPRLMADVAQLSVPLLAEVGVGANWDEAH